MNIEAYSDFEPNTGDKSKLTVKGILAYQNASFTAGVEAVQQIQKKYGLNNSDMSPLGISTYVWGTIIKDKKTKVSKLNAFARFDYFDPDTKTDSSGV